LNSSSEQSDKHRQLVLTSDFSRLEEAVDEAEAFYTRHIEDEEFVYKIVLLTSEAVTNAMEHGNKLDVSKSVFVDFILNDKACEVWVRDEGRGFDRSRIADPLAGDQLYSDGGRGIFLIEELADEVRFEENGCKLGMIFHRT